MDIDNRTLRGIDKNVACTVCKSLSHRLGIVTPCFSVVEAGGIDGGVDRNSRAAPRRVGAISSDGYRRSEDLHSADGSRNSPHPRTSAARTQSISPAQSKIPANVTTMCLWRKCKTACFQPAIPLPAGRLTCISAALLSFHAIETACSMKRKRILCTKTPLPPSQAF